MGRSVELMTLSVYFYFFIYLFIGFTGSSLLCEDSL